MPADRDGFLSKGDLQISIFCTGSYIFSVPPSRIQTILEFYVCNGVTLVFVLLTHVNKR